MTYFFDNHLPQIFAQILRSQGLDAIHLRERFPAGAEDVAWITEAGRQHWIAITADHKIRRHRAERLALKRANIVVFFCAKELNNKHVMTQIRWFAGRWEAIERQATQAEPGDLFEVPMKGPIRKIAVLL